MYSMKDQLPAPEPNDLPTYNKEGVDLTVIRGFLERTPAQRLRDVQKFAGDVIKIWARNGRA